jgi:hypothetical protein
MTRLSQPVCVAAGEKRIDGSRRAVHHTITARPHDRNVNETARCQHHKPSTNPEGRVSVRFSSHELMPVDPNNLFRRAVLVGYMRPHAKVLVLHQGVGFKQYCLVKRIATSVRRSLGRKSLRE